MRTGWAGPRFGWRLCVCLALLAAAPAALADSARERREDFDAMWRAIDTGYAYFEGHRARWKRARDAWRGKAAAARSKEEFISTLEGALATLHDDNVTISSLTRRSPRRVPLETDIWARFRDGEAVIEAVRFAGDGDVAGVRPGDVVTHIDGAPVDDVVHRLLAPARDATARERDWALRHALAGPRAGTLALELGGQAPRQAEIERADRVPAPVSPVSARRMGDERDIGYLRLRDLDDPKLPAQLDGALGYVKDARALIIDLREAHSGSRESARAVLSRLAAREGAWRQRAGRDGKLIVDRIAPRPGAGFNATVLVLVDRWTAGQAESLAAGLAALAPARLVGTPMAGLRGELRDAKLPHSGIVVRFPAEKTFAPDGTPIESVRPSVEVDLAAPRGGPGDPILYQALKLLEK